MKKCILLFVTGVFIVLVRGQSLTPTVIATCGGFSTGSANTLSYTVGETATPTLSNGLHILTQGFQQPDRDVTASVDENPVWSINAFPNPAESILNIHIQNCQDQNFNWQIIDSKGSTIQTSTNPITVNNELTFQVSVEQLVSGNYLLMLTAPNFRPYVIKFIKN